MDVLIKQGFYKRSVIKHLYFAGELSCAELSTSLGKSLPIINRLITELISEGTVIEHGYALSTGGRRPLMYSLKPDLQYIVAVGMDQLITRIVLLDMRNNPVGEIERLELRLAYNADALQQLTSHLAAFITKSGIPKEKIVGIGVGMPGFVDVTKGVNHSYLKTDNSIVSYIEEELGIPVLIDNDSSLVALAELKMGAARDKQNVMVLNISWGTGLGMIMNGELFRGHNGFAGEFSHIPLFVNNKLCYCGKTGCLETEASLLIIAEKAIKALKQGKNSALQGLDLSHVDQVANIIMTAAQKGDNFAIELIAESAYNIGRGVSILIHLFNPELIVLSGRGAAVGKLWLAPIQQAINTHCIPKIAENTEISISTLGYEAEILGAAALVMEHYETLLPASQKVLA
ncbi:ROK family protein (plasmid) [Hymenobacter tibetensis]|uniref:ROK family protein n=1 Tax=Hymenobacter tibetensis TaxID=497967 RepID=A0ABY4D4M0_9BACT|nr:ROK family protein [Hymenobacter tibetensis]UOG77455.1 ROK family protein [Hymenobacter tibetensis]